METTRFALHMPSTKKTRCICYNLLICGSKWWKVRGHVLLHQLLDVLGMCVVAGVP